MAGVRVQIFGTSDAAAAGTALIRAGDGRLKHKLYDAIRDANLGLEREIRQSALTHLPRRNGLAAEVASSRISIRRLFSDAEGVGISVSAHHQYDIGGMDADGIVIAPTFGHRPWHSQHVRAGWFSDATDGAEVRTRKFIDRACERFARSI